MLSHVVLLHFLSLTGLVSLYPSGKKSMHCARLNLRGRVLTRTSEPAAAAQTHAAQEEGFYVGSITDVTRCMVMEVLFTLGQLMTK